MAVLTHTLAVNAAFLREIKEENRQWRLLLGRAFTTFSQPAPQRLTPRETVELMRSLRDELALHFALEEGYGYLDDAIEVAPRLSCHAETLRAEHGPLFAEACALVEQAEQWFYHEPAARRTPHLAERFCQFHQQMLDHEARENGLIMEAFALDLGGGD